MLKNIYASPEGDTRFALCRPPGWGIIQHKTLCLTPPAVYMSPSGRRRNVTHKTTKPQVADAMMNEWRLRTLVISVALSAILLVKPANAYESFPASARQFFTVHCVDCHAGKQAEGAVNLDLHRVDWSAKSTTVWERVYKALVHHEMPPSDADQPSDDERKQMVQWLEGQLTRHSKIGGTVLRRLNRQEYENTIRDLFDMPNFEVPDAFPSDDSDYGFDNVGEALILSPPLLAQYLELATLVADEILPPDNGPVVAHFRQIDIGAPGLAPSAGTSVEGDRFRITASSPWNAFTAGWPTRFEAHQSGVYRLTVDATAFQTDKMFYPRQDKPFCLEVYAKMKNEQTYSAFKKIRKVAQFDVETNRDGPQTFTCEIELNVGEAFGVRWENGPNHTRNSPGERVKQDRRAYAALLQLGKDSRGMAVAQYYDETTALMNSDELDLNDPRLETPIGRIGFLGGPTPRGLMPHWFLNEELRRIGPALDVTDVSIEGPLRLIEDETTRVSKTRTAQFLGKRSPAASDREYAEAVLRRFLPQAFRRPVRDEEVRAYLELAMRAVTSPTGSTKLGRVEDGLHVAVRRALASPNFLYRSPRPGQLDDHGLASRLSYFLTQSPPDRELSELASRGQLSDPEVLEREALRLLRSPRCENFVHSFTGQWLGTRLLVDIMPDPRLVKYYEQHRRSMTDEVELFFAEILRENLSIESFIDPSFSYRNEDSNRFYGGSLKGKEMQRVELEPGDRHGGVLGLAAVMMATANGVDTHPVQRGVWLLNNVFGTPVPEPPPNVPAIAPDTNGTTTIKMQLAAHREDASCARCHNLIDPLGMVMENFDPVGRWRENYPIYTQPADGEEALKKQFYSNSGKGTKAGPVVDSVGVLSDGTRLEDVTDLKRYLLENSDMFSRCLTSKLLVYATGRPMNFADHRIVDQIVDDVKSGGNGFRDLIVALILSKTFGTK